LGEEIKREVREENMERENKTVGGRGGVVAFKKLTLLHYLQLHKYPSSKMNLPIKRLGYDAHISSSISQVESPDMRSHNSFTMGILPRSCFTCES